MLIVDDDAIDRSILINIFKDNFIVERARDANSALVQLRHYGSALSVVLLDINMPGIGGFEVLRSMQAHSETRVIPVIIVSADDDRKTAVKAIKLGAADMITKPVDPDLIRMRVESAIAKADNERLRAQNSFLSLRNTDAERYRFAFDRTGMLLVEYDWIRGQFLYETNMSKKLAGTWDKRGLWHILMSDMVAKVNDVKKMQELVHAVAEDRNSFGASTDVELKTASGEKVLFKFDIYKILNEFKLTDRLLLIFSDTRYFRLNNDAK